MRNDFNVMKDLAAHTRLTPEQRQREVGRLIDYIHRCVGSTVRRGRGWGHVPCVWPCLGVLCFRLSPSEAALRQRIVP